MTKPDLTNTAPKRIYLDIGDRSTLGRIQTGDLRWDEIEGVTWSEGNETDYGIPYVRADLVPTPAASGAAPAVTDALYDSAYIAGAKAGFSAANSDDPNAALASIIDSRSGYLAALASREASSAPLTETPQELERALGQAIDERDERDEVIDALCDAVLGKHRAEWSSMYGFRDAVSEVEEHMAALASPQPAPLTDERIAELWIEHGLDEDEPEGFARIIEREVRAALASPQVAPAPEHDPNCSTLYHARAKCDCSLAAPVQVAPTGWKLVPVVQTREMAEAAVQAICYGPEGGFTRTTGPSRCWAAMLAAAPVAPQDDARDAAESRNTEAVLRLGIEVEKLLCAKLGVSWTPSGISIVSLIDRLAASTPAAKPAEPTLPTQGEKS